MQTYPISCSFTVFSIASKRHYCGRGSRILYSCRQPLVYEFSVAAICVQLSSNYMSFLRTNTINMQLLINPPSNMACKVNLMMVLSQDVSIVCSNSHLCNTSFHFILDTIQRFFENLLKILKKNCSLL